MPSRENKVGATGRKGAGMSPAKGEVTDGTAAARAAQKAADRGPKRVVPGTAKGAKQTEEIGGRQSLGGGPLP